MTPAGPGTDPGPAPSVGAATCGTESPARRTYQGDDTMRTRMTLAAAVLLTATLAFGQGTPYKGGFPPPDAAQKARDDADYQRAITAYRFWYPTVSCEGIFNGNRELGINDN